MVDYSKIIKQIPKYDPYRDAGDCVFNPGRAKHACEFFPKFLTHVKGDLAGQPYHLQPHEQAIVANIFGWHRPDGTRRYREVLYFVPRKNSKTTLAAGIAILVTATDNEPGAENYCAAADAAQADIFFSIAKQMIAQDDVLRNMFDPYKRSIILTDWDGEGSPPFLRVLSSTADTKHGQSGHAVFIDELHVVNQDLVDVLKTSTGSRRQPLIFYTTTSDFERISVCNTIYDYAKQVRSGRRSDPSFLPVIYEAGKKDDWTSPKTWAKSNPNLGHSIRLDYIQRECERAKNSPAYENVFKRLHLNMRTEQAERWISAPAWDKCSTANGDPRGWRERMLEDLKGYECTIGLDLGNTADLTAMVAAFEHDDRVVLIPWFWVPEETVQNKPHRYRLLYQDFIDRGFLETTEGNITDYEHIRFKLTGIDAHGNETESCLRNDYYVKLVAVDRNFNSGQMSTWLQHDGLEVLAHAQSLAGMTSPVQEFERRLMGGLIDHGDNPILKWMADNVALQADASGTLRRPVKTKEELKIDGIVAAVMAVGRMAMLPEGGGKSCYETERLIFV